MTAAQQLIDPPNLRVHVTCAYTEAGHYSDEVFAAAAKVLGQIQAALRSGDVSAEVAAEYFGDMPTTDLPTTVVRAVAESWRRQGKSIVRPV